MPRYPTPQLIRASLGGFFERDTLHLRIDRGPQRFSAAAGPDG